MNKKEIIEILYKEKNYSKIKDELKNCSDSWSFNMLGKIALYEINPDDAFEYFNKAGNVYGCAYCKFLTGDIEESRILSTLIKNTSPTSDWILCITNILCDDFSVNPTYFQIRNFYEQDLELLFLYKQYAIINKLINLNKYFETFNREIYKYSARVLANNSHYKESKQLLKKSLEIYYKDPETHYMLGEIYEKENDLEKAKLSYKKAIEVNTEYMPASIRLKDLTN